MKNLLGRLARTRQPQDSNHLMPVDDDPVGRMLERRRESATLSEQADPLLDLIAPKPALRHAPISVADPATDETKTAPELEKPILEKPAPSPQMESPPEPAQNVAQAAQKTDSQASPTPPKQEPPAGKAATFSKPEGTSSSGLLDIFRQPDEKQESVLTKELDDVDCETLLADSREIARRLKRRL